MHTEKEEVRGAAGGGEGKAHDKAGQIDTAKKAGNPAFLLYAVIRSSRSRCRCRFRSTEAVR